MQLPGQTPTRRAFWQKQIPVLAGLAVLVIALVAGLVMFSDGLGVFAPRATPQTTPKQVKITNVGDKAFTVSFYTDETTVGFVKYGLVADTLKTQASDDRDQLTGSVGKFSLHHITVKSLKPNTAYYFTVGTGSGSSFDNNGVPFMVKTAADPGTPPPVAKTVYGNVMTPGGTPAEGSVVYLAAEGGGELSALVKASGSWAISLASARVSDGTSYLNITDDTALTVFVQSAPLSQTAQVSTTVKEAQPLADVTLGKTVALDESAIDEPTPEPTTEADSASDSAEVQDTPAASASATPSPTLSLAPLAASPSASASSKSATVAASASAKTATPSAVLNLEQLASKPGSTAVVIPAPKIMGMAKPSVEVKVSVHSEVEITDTVTADANGNFTLDLSKYQDLEPGEHTVTYSYTDPTTGQEVTKTQTFTVAPKQLAMAPLGAGTTPTVTPTKTSTASATKAPFGSGNPYPISTASTDTSTRSTAVATTSSAFKSGSVGATVALIGGGLFLMLIGWWSWWLAGQVREELD